MDFKSALEELKKGKKIRRREWEKSIYLKEDTFGNVQTFNTVAEYYRSNNLFNDCPEWLLQGEEEKIGFKFMDLIDKLQEGKKIYQVSWPKNHYIKISSNGKDLIFHSEAILTGFEITFQCMTSKDWEVLDDGEKLPESKL